MGGGKWCLGYCEGCSRGGGKQFVPKGTLRASGPIAGPDGGASNLRNGSRLYLVGEGEGGGPGGGLLAPTKGGGDEDPKGEAHQKKGGREGWTKFKKDCSCFGLGRGGNPLLAGPGMFHLLKTGGNLWINHTGGPTWQVCFGGGVVGRGFRGLVVVFYEKPQWFWRARGKDGSPGGGGGRRRVVFGRGWAPRGAGGGWKKVVLWEEEFPRKRGLVVGSFGGESAVAFKKSGRSGKGPPKKAIMGGATRVFNFGVKKGGMLTSHLKRLVRRKGKGGAT